MAKTPKDKRTALERSLQELKSIVDFAQAEFSIPDRGPATELDEWGAKLGLGHLRWNDIGEQQHTLRQDLHGIAAYRSLRSISTSVKTTLRLDLKTREISKRIDADVAARLLYRILELLSEVGPDRLRICPATLRGLPCGRLFVKIKQAKYCSVTCQVREGARRNYTPKEG